jgi:hypothetical protein
MGPDGGRPDRAPMGPNGGGHTERRGGFGDLTGGWMGGRMGGRMGGNLIGGGADVEFGSEGGIDGEPNEWGGYTH